MSSWEFQAEINKLVLSLYLGDGDFYFVFVLIVENFPIQTLFSFSPASGWKKQEKKRKTFFFFHQSKFK